MDARELVDKLQSLERHGVIADAPQSLKRATPREVEAPKPKRLPTPVAARLLHGGLPPILLQPRAAQ